MTWVAVALVLAIGSGAASVPLLLLFRPWRMRRLAFRLARVWPWYRSRLTLLLLRRFTRAVQEASRAIGERLIPAMEATAETARKLAAARQE